MRLYLLHPILVHFPIVLLLLGYTLCCLETFRKKPEWLYSAVSWLLGLGAVSVWIVVGTGLLAEKTAPHIPAAWEVLDAHTRFGFLTGGISTVVLLLRLLIKRRWKWIFFVSYTALIALLVITAYYGGELVYTYGMGVKK